jgi:hypothetical protein
MRPSEANAEQRHGADGFAAAHAERSALSTIISGSSCNRVGDFGHVRVEGVVTAPGAYRCKGNEHRDVLHRQPAALGGPRLRRAY